MKAKETPGGKTNDHACHESCLPRLRAKHGRSSPLTLIQASRKLPINIMRPYIWTHVIHDHRSRPTILDLACPKCTEKVSFQKHSEQDRAFSNATSGTWHLDDWNGRCINCISDFINLSYDELPDYFYKDAETGIWAYNEDHLNHLICYFSDTAVESTYSFYDNYLRREWLTNKKKCLKALKKMA